MLRKVLIVMAALAAFAAMTAPSVAAKGGGGGGTGNKLDAKSCQKDGWKTLARSTSSTVAFSSHGNCRSYGAKKSNTIVRLQRLLTASTSGTGTVTSDPPGISCGTNCLSFDHGASVMLAAAPATGSTFSGWSGACTGTGTCTVNMDQSRTATATFTAATQATAESTCLAWKSSVPGTPNSDVGFDDSGVKYELEPEDENGNVLPAGYYPSGIAFQCGGPLATEETAFSWPGDYPAAENLHGYRAFDWQGREYDSPPAMGPMPSDPLLQALKTQLDPFCVEATDAPGQLVAQRWHYSFTNGSGATDYWYYRCNETSSA